MKKWSIIWTTRQHSHYKNGEKIMTKRYTYFPQNWRIAAKSQIIPSIEQKNRHGIPVRYGIHHRKKKVEQQNIDHKRNPILSSRNWSKQKGEERIAETNQKPNLKKVRISASFPFLLLDPNGWNKCTTGLSQLSGLESRRTVATEKKENQE